MTAIQWARTVRCDFPSCGAQGTVALDDTWPARKLPDGWLDLAAIGAALTLPDGGRAAELCPAHAAVSVGTLLAALAAP